MFFGSGSITDISDVLPDNPTDDQLLAALKDMAGPTKPLEDVDLSSLFDSGSGSWDATDLVKLANSDPAAAQRLAASIANNINSTPAQSAALAAYNASVQQVYRLGQQSGATAGALDKLAATLGIDSSTLVWGAIGTVVAVLAISAVMNKRGR
jgi:hypothetical protein